MAATCGAISHRVRVLSPFMAHIELVMREALASLRIADLPPAQDASGAVIDMARLVALTDGVPMGRRQDGSPWLLRVRGRHTLVVGCSGSGKGSLLWGIAGGLAPAVRGCGAAVGDRPQTRGGDRVRGGPVHHDRVHPHRCPGRARRLVEVIAVRGDQMAGRARLHQPRPGDPLHVLVIDELATLTAYGDKAEREEANRLLAEIQSQGRALGVVVVAFVQDPRKDTVPTRSLFTQTVALRLRSASEVTMVLGDGMAALAPAHRVSPAAPGTGTSSTKTAPWTGSAPISGPTPSSGTSPPATLRASAKPSPRPHTPRTPARRGRPRSTPRTPRTGSARLWSTSPTCPGRPANPASPAAHASHAPRARLGRR